MLIIKNEHIDKKGIHYKIKDYSCNKVSDINEVVGKGITESHYSEENKYYENGIYLMKHKKDSNKAFRIYKDYNLYDYIYHDDANMLSELNKRQKDVKLTEFPTAVISVNNTVIGQEIPYYDGYIPLIKKIKDIKSPKELLYIYKQIIEIIKELLENGIYYKDIHAGNFMIKDNIIKLIDFDTAFIDFDDERSYSTVIYNLKWLLMGIDVNKLINLDLKECNIFDEVEQKVKSKVM